MKDSFQLAPDGIEQLANEAPETTKPLLVRLPESTLAILKKEASRDESSVNSIIV